MGFLTREFNQLDEDDRPVIRADLRPKFIDTSRPENMTREQRKIAEVFNAFRRGRAKKEEERAAEKEGVEGEGGQGAGGEPQQGYEEFFS